jgi:hypothetical protein
VSGISSEIGVLVDQSVNHCGLKLYAVSGISSKIGILMDESVDNCVLLVVLKVKLDISV